VKKRVRTDPNKGKTGKIVFDLSFEGIMVNREVKSLFSQIIRCYSANRRSDLPFELEISSFKGELSESFRTIYPEHERWDVSFNSEHFIKTASDHENIIYLTPDSDQVLEDISADFTYVIGGIVDKNRFKGKTFESANSLNIKTARLPVPEYIDLKTSPVLTIYHVFEILLKYKDCKDWREALESYVPKRNMKNDSEISETLDSESE
jgi:tRNA (guanine9-N1)-methyltransferase